MNVCTCVYVFVLSDNVISVLLLKRDFALFFGCTECVNNFHIHSYIRNAVESTTGLWGEDCVFQSSPCDWGMAPRQTALPGCDDWDRGTTAGPHRHHRQVQSLCMYLFIYSTLCTLYIPMENKNQLSKLWNHSPCQMTFTTAPINKKLQIVDSVLGYMPLFLPVFTYVIPVLYLWFTCVF